MNPHVSPDRKHKSPTYISWLHMRARCNNPKDKDYQSYGGRGIRVCARWSRFANFLADMGVRPDGTQLDRANNEGHYKKSNCRWSTRRENSGNRRNSILVTAGGITHHAAEWDRIKGFGRDTVSARIARGWSPERAVSTPMDQRYNRKRAA